MTTITGRGLYIELMNRTAGRVAFTAATDQLDYETFAALWKQVGVSIYNGAVIENTEAPCHFELRVSPIR